MTRLSNHLVSALPLQVANPHPLGTKPPNLDVFLIWRGRLVEYEPRQAALLQGLITLTLIVYAMCVWKARFSHCNSGGHDPLFCLMGSLTKWWSTPKRVMILFPPESLGNWASESMRVAQDHICGCQLPIRRHPQINQTRSMNPMFFLVFNKLNSAQRDL